DPISMGPPIDRDMAGQVPSREMRLQRLTAGVKRTGLAPDIVRGRGRTAPPMIKHPRNVMDALCAFDNAKKKIVVLCAIKLGTESAHLPHEIAPQQGQVANVVAGKKIVRRPIGFEDRGVETL